MKELKIELDNDRLVLLERNMLQGFKNSNMCPILFLQNTRVDYKRLWLNKCFWHSCAVIDLCIEHLLYNWLS